MYQQDSEYNSDKKVVAIDLFCGAGGLTRGLRDAGIEVKFGVDVDDNFRRTYEHNNKPSIFYRADIRSLSGLDLSRFLNLQPDNFFILAACAPCQPFSRHNKNHRYDRRKSLLLEVGRILQEFERKPDALFIENVPAIAKIDNGKILKNFYKILDGLSYSYESKIINAKDYGVPQTRRRFIMLGIKKSLFSTALNFPDKTHGKNLLPYRTVKETIGHLPSLRAGQQHKHIFNHEAASLSVKNLERLSFVPKNGGSRDSWPERLRLKCHVNHSGHKDVYGRMRWKSPSPTLTCKCISISNGRFGHPAQLRAISLKEAALLQTFPDNYAFYGMFINMAMQIGNAVPVKLAEVFGRYLVKLLLKSPIKSEQSFNKKT